MQRCCFLAVGILITLATTLCSTTTKANFTYMGFINHTNVDGYYPYTNNPLVLKGLNFYYIRLLPTKFNTSASGLITNITCRAFTVPTGNASFWLVKERGDVYVGNKTNYMLLVDNEMQNELLKRTIQERDRLTSNTGFYIAMGVIGGGVLFVTLAFLITSISCQIVVRKASAMDGPIVNE